MQMGDAAMKRLDGIRLKLKNMLHAKFLLHCSHGRNVLLALDVAIEQPLRPERFPAFESDWSGVGSQAMQKRLFVDDTIVT
jgi:hypothetical protein